MSELRDRLAEYVSHKRVRAGEIVAFDLANPEAPRMRLKASDGSIFPYTGAANLFARGLAKEGDFIVLYDDGYVSWSPRKAFEGGYSRVGNER